MTHRTEPAVQALVQGSVQAPLHSAGRFVQAPVQALVQGFVQALCAAKCLSGLAFSALCRLCRHFPHTYVRLRMPAGGRACRRAGRRGLAGAGGSTPLHITKKVCGEKHLRLCNRQKSACTAPCTACTACTTLEIAR